MSALSDVIRRHGLTADSPFFGSDDLPVSLLHTVAGAWGVGVFCIRCDWAPRLCILIGCNFLDQIFFSEQVRDCRTATETVETKMEKRKMKHFFKKQSHSELANICVCWPMGGLRYLVKCFRIIRLFKSVD